MSNFAIIGLSTFSSVLGKRLSELGHDIIVVDKDQERIQNAKDWATQAVLADATDKETLETVGVSESDAAIVSLGENIDKSILATLFLKEMGIPNIIAKGVTPDHKKILELVGATEIIFPENEMAIRTANRISSPNILDHIALEEGYSIIEVETPKTIVGKTLAESALRSKYHVSVIFIKKMQKGTKKERIFLPEADTVIEAGDKLMLGGKDEHLAKISRL